jgi:hypothetical protein
MNESEENRRRRSMIRNMSGGIGRCGSFEKKNSRLNKQQQ